MATRPKVGLVSKVFTFPTEEEANQAAIHAAKEYIDTGKVPEGWTLVTVFGDPEERH